MNVYLVDLKYIMKATGFGKTKIYKEIKHGTFPPAVKIGRSSRWPSNEVEAWINAHIAKREILNGWVMPDLD